VSCIHTRPVLIEEGDVKRVGPAITGRIYYLDGKTTTLSDDKVKYPEGYYMISPEMYNALMEISKESTK